MQLEQEKPLDETLVEIKASIYMQELRNVYISCEVLQHTSYLRWFQGYPSDIETLEIHVMVQVGFKKLFFNRLQRTPFHRSNNHSLYSRKLTLVCRKIFESIFSANINVCICNGDVKYDSIINWNGIIRITFIIRCQEI